MTYKCVKEVFAVSCFDSTQELYISLGNENVTVDESDLVIFRLMGVQFDYASVIFEETNPVSLLTESVVS